MKVATVISGGFGDILRVYFSGNQEFSWCQPCWGKMEQWIQAGNEIRLIVASHNPFAANFFEYVPWVNAILKVPWRQSDNVVVPEFTRGYAVVTHYELDTFTRNLSWVMPKVYLSVEEKELFQGLIKDKYIFLYPFGGYGPRIPASLYLPLIEKIVKGGLKVIIAGGTHTRYTGGVCDKYIEEKIDFALPDGAISVVGGGTRLCTALVLNAQAYVGSLGCYMHAALAVGIQSHVFTCWEVWDDKRIIKTSGHNLGILMRNAADPEGLTEVYILNNEEKTTLHEIYDAILTGIFCEPTSGIYRMGDEKREPVHV